MAFGYHTQHPERPVFLLEYLTVRVHFKHLILRAEIVQYICASYLLEYHRLDVGVGMVILTFNHDVLLVSTINQCY